MTLDLLERVRERGGLESIDAAAEVARATLRTLGEAISEADARAVARRLPADLADAVLEGPHDGRTTEDAFYRRVAIRTQLEPGRAMELAQVVLVPLGEILDPETVTRLHLHLPEGLAGQLGPRDVRSPARPLHVAGGTLRPGTVRESNPHGASKLSSGILSRRSPSTGRTTGSDGPRPLGKAATDTRE